MATPNENKPLSPDEQRLYALLYERGIALGGAISDDPANRPVLLAAVRRLNELGAINYAFKTYTTPEGKTERELDANGKFIVIEAGPVNFQMDAAGNITNADSEAKRLAQSIEVGRWQSQEDSYRAGYVVRKDNDGKDVYARYRQFHPDILRSVNTTLRNDYLPAALADTEEVRSSDLSGLNAYLATQDYPPLTSEEFAFFRMTGKVPASGQAEEVTVQGRDVSQGALLAASSTPRVRSAGVSSVDLG